MWRALRHVALWLVPLLAGLALLYVLQTAGLKYDFHRMNFGSVLFPRPTLVRFNSLYSVLGGLSLLLITRAFVEFGPIQVPRALRSPRLALGVGVLAAFVFPILVRTYLIYGMPFSDDERVYLYAAQLLASGQLQTSSHPLPAFFDHVFVINDGVRYTQYFLGWPMLLMPGVWLGAPWLMNPLYWALALPPVYLVAKRVAGESAALLAIVIHVFSPMWLLFAASYLSHVTTALFLAWTTWAALRSRDEDAPGWIDGLLAILFCFGFFVRPYTMLAGGSPALLWWLAGAWRDPRRLGAFALPAGLMAALFLGLNQVMNGGVFKTGYGAYWEYLERVDFRNHGSWKEIPRTEDFIPNLRFEEFPKRLRVFAAGTYRLFYNWLGWPIGFALAVFAPARSEGLLCIAMVATMSLASLGMADVGVDVVGPVHMAEVSIPLTWVTVAGWAALRANLHASELARRWLTALIPALLLVTAVGYVQHRWTSVQRTAHVIRKPFTAIEKAGVHDAVVFYERGFSRQCVLKHFVYGGPINPPGPPGDLVFALDRGEENARLMAYYPGRRAYRLVPFGGCRYRLERID